MSFFISLEGVEGVGKSTAKDFIASEFKNKKIDFILTREPGGTHIAEAIRHIVLHHEGEDLLPETELLLVFAARAQHINTVIKPALDAGKSVISDRFVDASFAYQGGGRQIAMDRLDYLNNWIVGKTKPDLTLLLDAPVEVGLERLKSRGKKDRIEKEDIEFFERVRDTYLARAAAEPNRFVIIQADQSLEKVEVAIRASLSRLWERAG